VQRSIRGQRKFIGRDHQPLPARTPPRECSGRHKHDQQENESAIFAQHSFSNPHSLVEPFG